MMAIPQRLQTDHTTPTLNGRNADSKKGTLHYMKKNAEGDQPFTINKHVMTRLDQWDQSADKRGSTVDLGK